MNVLIVGKRYRWTVEGVGVDIGSGGVALESSGGNYVFSTQMLAAGAVEQLPDPLPTTPGSVVQWLDTTSGSVIVCVRGTSNVAPWTPVSVIGRVWYGDDNIAGATVLFAAGAGQ